MNTEPYFDAPLNEADIAARLDAEQQERSAAQNSFLPPLGAVGVMAVMAIAIPLAFSMRNSPYSPFASATAAPAPAFIPWSYDFEAAQRQAAANGKPLLISFYTDWCPTCKWMDQEVYSRSPIIVESQNFVPVKINAEIRTDLAQRYNIHKYPSLLWLDAQGNETHRSDGSLNGYELYDAMQRYH